MLRFPAVLAKPMSVPLCSLATFERLAFRVGTVIAEDTANKLNTTSTLTKPDVNTIAKATNALQNTPINISRFSPVFFSKGPVKKPCTTIKTPANTIQTIPACPVVNPNLSTKYNPVIPCNPVWQKFTMKISNKIIPVEPRSILLRCAKSKDSLLCDCTDRSIDSGKSVTINMKAINEIPAPVKNGSESEYPARMPPNNGPIITPTLIEAPSWLIFLLLSFSKLESPTYAKDATDVADDKIPDKLRAINSVQKEEAKPNRNKLTA